jgi:multiple sugar transport system ATP-binding protein
MTMGDRIVVMKDGLIQQVGSPLELYDQPANKFVGGFIGSPAMNFFDAELNGSEETVTLQAGDVRIDLPSEKSKKLADNPEKSVIVGIRPEDLKPASEHIAGKTIQGTVEVVEPIGNETYVDLNAGSFNLIAAVGRKSQIKPHSPLVLNPTMDNLHLFETGSEIAIF